MRTPSTWRITCGASVVVVGLLAMGCDGAFTIAPRSGACSLTVEQGFPSGTFTSSAPASCPFNIPNPNYLVNYAAQGSFRSDSIIQFQYQFQVVNRNGVVSQNGGIYASWNYNYYGGATNNYRWDILASGQYSAGTGGFDDAGNGFDDVKSILQNNRYEWKAATSHLTYKWGNPNVYNNLPASMAEGESRVLNAGVNDPGWVGPTTWSWYVDGTLAQSGGDTFPFTAGPDGTVTEVLLTGTDANGVTRSGVSSVTSRRSCPGTEIIC